LTGWHDQPAIFSTRLRQSPRRKPDLSPLATHGQTPRPRKFERELIRARTGEGRERAKAQGMRMGRKPKLTDHQKCEAIKRCDHGDETLAEIGRSYNVSGWTISRLA
jgi:hypothetical protein